MIYGNAVGGSGLERAFILVDDEGKEFPAVFVENEVVFTATANDIRLGKVAASESGVVEGTKEIPPYYTVEGYRAVANGTRFILPSVYYDYTKLLAIICPFNTSMANSVSAEKVSIGDRVYPVLSTEPETEVVKDTNNSRIDFGFTNTSGKNYLIRFMLYKEIY